MLLHKESDVPLKHDLNMICSLINFLLFCHSVAYYIFGLDIPNV